MDVQLNLTGTISYLAVHYPPGFRNADLDNVGYRNGGYRWRI